MEKANNLIKLKNLDLDLDKRKDYVGIKFDIVIDDSIDDNGVTLKNVDIIIHRVFDCIDLFCFKSDQTKDVLKKLEKYKSKELSSSGEYRIPNISIPVRIIMVERRGLFG